MSVKVAVYRLETQHRPKVICEAILNGIRKLGDKPVIRNALSYQGRECDVAVFYGFIGPLPTIMADHAKDGSAVYIDLGYWGRHAGGRWNGYHKISVNARHPTAYFRNVHHDGYRLRPFLSDGIYPPKPYQNTGRNILIAGMGNKGAQAEGYGFEAWERNAIEEIRKYTDRPIVYRPKPSHKNAPPISGTIFSPPEEDVQVQLADCHAVVTHHSNVAIDGLVRGIPAFCWHGVGSPMALQDFSKIEQPWCPDGRKQWMRDISYTQFNVEEMKNGVAWRHLKEEGLIP